MAASRSADPRSTGSFTIPILRGIMDDVLKQSQTKPSQMDLELLAYSLNQIREVFAFAQQTANESKPLADRVRDAIEVLKVFFERRRQACCVEDGTHPSVEIIENEWRLREQFSSFLKAMEMHKFELDMDAGLLMPRLDCWRQLAEVVANQFRAAMSRANGTQKFGYSNDGPVPRFVAAVVPRITGENPSVQNVGKHLKDLAHARKQGQGGRKVVPGRTQ
jgi:hypothetical protein